MRGAGFVVLNHVLQLKYYLNLELCPLIRMGRFGWPKYTSKIRSTSDLVTVNSDRDKHHAPCTYLCTHLIPDRTEKSILNSKINWERVNGCSPGRWPKGAHMPDSPHTRPTNQSLYVSFVAVAAICIDKTNIFLTSQAICIVPTTRWSMSNAIHFAFHNIATMCASMHITPIKMSGDPCAIHTV